MCDQTPNLVFLPRFFELRSMFREQFGSRDMSCGSLNVYSTSDVLTRKFSNSGLLGSKSSGEGWVCKFEGPGIVYIQTRNPKEFARWMGAHAALA